MKNVFILSTLLFSLNLFSQSTQKFEFFTGINTAYFSENNFYPGFHAGIQTAIPLKKSEKKYFCIGLEYNYFAIQATRKNNITDPITIKSDNVYTAFSIGKRRVFKNSIDNFFQWAIALNISSQGGLGFGPRVGFGFKVIDRNKHRFFLSPHLGLNIYSLGDEFIVVPIYGYASLKMIYQFSKE